MTKNRRSVLPNLFLELLNETSSTLNSYSISYYTDKSFMLSIILKNVCDTSLNSSWNIMQTEQILHAAWSGLTLFVKKSLYNSLVKQ